MANDQKQLIVEVSSRFHADVKSIAAKNRTTIKQIVIEALAAYINSERGKKD